MLPKQRRIEKALFSKVFSTGKRLVTPHFLVSISKMGISTPSKFAFSVSKKICKNAVDRNRLRRQGYSIVSKYIKNVTSGYIFIFTYKKGIYPTNFSELEKEIKSTLPLNKSD